MKQVSDQKTKNLYLDENLSLKYEYSPNLKQEKANLLTSKTYLKESIN